MKKMLLFSLAAVILSVAVNYLLFGCKARDNKIGWINLSKVYSDFTFKKELESKLTKTQQVRKNIMDSLEFELKVLSKQIKAEDQKDKNKIALYEVKREAYMKKKNQFEEDNAMMEKEYNAQILTQINQYTKDYARQNEYTYILGSDGNGTLMFADETKDVTAEVGKYINEKYKGKAE